MDPLDQKLLDLLHANAREATASLARKLGLARSTVQERIRRLEQRGLIAGYTLRLNPDYAKQRITAHVMISVIPKYAEQTVKKLKQLPAVKALHAVSGQYDLIAMLVADSTQAIDHHLDEIGRIDGIEKTMSSIVLSTKFER